MSERTDFLNLSRAQQTLLDLYREIRASHSRSARAGSIPQSASELVRATEEALTLSHDFTQEHGERGGVQPDWPSRHPLFQSPDSVQVDSSRLFDPRVMPADELAILELVFGSLSSTDNPSFMIYEFIALKAQTQDEEDKMSDQTIESSMVEPNPFLESLRQQEWLESRDAREALRDRQEIAQKLSRQIEKFRKIRGLG